MNETRPSELIALLTDFGLSDWFVGAMKGEILSRAPQARLIDLTHDVPPQNVRAGAFALEAALPSLPSGAVVCAVVDPGVGSARRAVCGRIGDYFWSGPDNGLATPLLHRAGGRAECYEIAHPAWRRDEVSSTFHGRDLFAPAAARLVLGASPQGAGPRVETLLELPSHDPVQTGPGQWRGEIVWIDHFGNCITNFGREEFKQECVRRSWELRTGNLRVACGPGTTYAAVEPGAALVYWGSTGHLEIAINRGDAHRAAGVTVGDAVEVLEI